MSKQSNFKYFVSSVFLVLPLCFLIGSFALDSFADENESRLESIKMGETPSKISLRNTNVRKMDGERSRYQEHLYRTAMSSNTTINNDTTIIERVTDGLTALFTFNEGNGSTVHDVSGVGSALDLTIDNESAVTWLPQGGLSINNSTIIKSNQPATKLIDAAKISRAITFEAWVRPANIFQNGPARIVTISTDTGNRNMTLGQQYDYLNGRIRTTQTSKNGLPAISSPAGELTTGLHHLVFSRSRDGSRKIYIDGSLRISDSSITGSLNNWNETYHLGLANELNGERPWLGDYFLVAVYDRALSASEVSQNFTAAIPDQNSNSAPKAVTDQLSMLTGEVASINVLLNDYDLNNDALTVSAVSSPEPLVSVNINSDNLVEVTADSNLTAETVIVSCTIEDIHGASDNGSIEITFINNLGRVSQDLQALYLFNESDGAVVNDVSGVTPALNLTISDINAVNWLDGGGLALLSATSIYSADPASKIFSATQASNEVTVEAWVTPENLTQSGPARIISLSADSGNRNVTLGQVHDYLQGRVRTTKTNNNGIPSFDSPQGGLSAGLQHLVFTRSDNGDRKIYINGVEVAKDRTIVGDLSNWDSRYQLTLGNEFIDDRAWLGTYYLAAVYSRALGAEEIYQNLIAGPSNFSNNTLPEALADRAITEPDMSVTLDVLANDSDQDGDELTVLSISQPDDGEAILNSDNSITYNPESGFIGLDSFTYVVSDGKGGNAEATVKVVVGYAIEAKSKSALFTGTGQTRTLEINIYDSSLTTLAARAPDLITWSTDAPSVITLTPNNNTAEIQSNVNLGSAMVTASYKNSIILIPIIIATLENETHVIEADDFEEVNVVYTDGVISSMSTVLKRNATTNKIIPGDIILNAENTEKIEGVSMRVTSVSGGSDSVRLQGTLATLNDAYRYLDVQLKFKPKTGSTQNLVNSKAAGISQILKCSTSNPGLSSVSTTLFSLEKSQMPITPVATIILGDNGLTEFFLGADIDMDMRINGPSLNFISQIGFEFECDIPLSKLFDLFGFKAASGELTFPIGTTPLRLAILPSVGIEGKLAMTLAEATASLGDIHFQYGARFGARYNGTGWDSVKEITQKAQLDVNLFSFEKDLGPDVELELFPRFRASAGIGISLIPASKFNLQIFSAELGRMNTLSVPIAAVPNLFNPRPPSSLYESPEWRTSNLATVALEPGLSGDVVNLIDKYVGTKLSEPVFELELYRIENVVAETPAIPIKASASIIPPNTSTSLSIRVRPFGTFSIESLVYAHQPVEVWASKDQASAELIGEGQIDEIGEFSFDWTPTEEGQYEISAQIFDNVTGTFLVPYLTEAIDVTVSENTDVLIDSFEATLTNTTAPLIVNFTWQLNNPSGGNVVCNLNPGDGTTAININDCANNNSYTYTYNEAGHYTATLTTANDTRSVEITVAKWRFDTGQAVFSSPVLSNDETVVYIGSDDNNLYALDASSGNMLWRFDVGRAIQMAPAVGSDGTIYVSGKDNSLYALNVDGTQKWLFTGTHTILSPAIASDGTVYVASLDCNLYSLDPQTGNENWRLLLSALDSCFGFSPVVGSNGVVYARHGWAGISRDEVMMAVNPDSSVKWSITNGRFRMPAIAADGTIIVAGYYLQGIDPDNGNTKWILEHSVYFPGFSGDLMSPAIGANGVIYIGDAHGYMNAISPDGSNVLWQTMLEQSSYYFSSPALGADGTVYVGRSSGKVYAVAPGGEIAWTYPTGADIFSSPAIAKDGTVYIGSVDHYLYALPSDSLGLDNGPWPKDRGNNQNTALAQ